MVECKTSRADFLGDRMKTCRKDGRATMGMYRYFLTIRGLVTPADIERYYPDHGLLEPSGRGVRIVRLAPRREAFNHVDEIEMLRTAVTNMMGHLWRNGCTIDVTKMFLWKAWEDVVVFPEQAAMCKCGHSRLEHSVNHASMIGCRARGCECYEFDCVTPNPLQGEG